MRRLSPRITTTALLLATLAAGTPDAAMGRPKPGASHGFRLFARAVGALTINRVYCGIASIVDICVDSLGGGVAGGGFWPKGTANQYVFNSGIQFAGIIDGGPWANDTAGGGFEVGGVEVLRQVYNFVDPDDARNWPEAAYVPSGDATEQFFDPLLRGRPSASQGDVWTLMWDGNPRGKGHPLGVLVEMRGMGWNYPAGNEDLVYFIFTFYNVTASDCSVYAALRESIRSILCEQGRKFQELNAAKFGVALPPSGYTIGSMYTGLTMDADVAHYSLNFASVNLPFSMGFAYDNTFYPETGWTFDPGIFGAPFFAGSGFVGIKYLSSPPDSLGRSVGLTLFNTYSLGEGGPGDGVQLYRYLSGKPDRKVDAQCNTGDPAVTHICRINYADPTDMRFSQSSGPLTLPPGGSGSVAVAYLFAAPVRTDGCSPPCAVRPDNPTRFLDPAVLAGGANTVDTLTGYTGYLGDVNGNGRVDQEEITTVPGSLLAKGLVAQAVFDRQFLLPSAPEPPDFFLIPGDNEVTVLWQPSASETEGDRFFQLAASPVDLNGRPNPLYDPNYRQFDVEGYRVYRGRANSPSSLQLVAQFDYAGTLLSDFTGQVNPTDECAPELGIQGNCPATTPAGGFDSVGPGIALTHHVDYDLSGIIVQVRPGGRVALASGKVLVTAADTAVAGGATHGPCAPSPCPALANTGVPFVYVDRAPLNSFRYFYTVTAFDVNSLRSGASSLESPRTAKAVTPVRSAPTYSSSSRIVSTQIVGRGVRVDDRFLTPTLDPTTGRFSGPFPAGNGAAIGFSGELVSKVVDGFGSYSVTLDSLGAGSAYDASPVRYYLSVNSGTNTAQFVIPVTQSPFEDTGSNSATFPAVLATDSLAQLYGGDSSFVAGRGQATISLAGNYYTGSWGRGCINGAPGFNVGGGCSYNGTRWFDGPSPQHNEIRSHPNAGNGAVDAAPAVDRALPGNGGFNNAGQLTGVEVIHQPLAYLTMPNVYRSIHGVLGSFKRAADYNVYWSAGTPGRIDSVVDVTHNVPLPLDSVPARGMNTGFGVLTQANAQPVAGSFDGRTELTIADFDCVEPLRHMAAAEARIPCGAPDDPADGPRYALVRQATLGPIAFAATSLADFQTSTNTGTGFALYLAGNTYLIQTSTLPSGVVWSMRDYVGAITGGLGFGGDQGPYAFSPVIRPFSAEGATVTVNFQSSNIHRAVTAADLSKVHTVPDPYYVTNAFERTTAVKVIKFVNLPEQAIIRIYTVSGVLVTILEHNSPTFGGEETWNVLNRNNQVVASGVYFYHIEANVNGGTARRIGRMTIVNFAD
jgi:hypothetical protein